MVALFNVSGSEPVILALPQPPIDAVQFSADSRGLLGWDGNVRAIR
ncbi:hypothetical protein DSM104299_03032 [Baekduia alba]|nr:hypothetical protein [Baekduia alba]WCB94300.1 hypothetical protein DSM104299_03032 [Baekduia alba]